MAVIKLYDYWRSSACYRVRIALNLKGIEYQSQSIHLVRDGGEQHTAEFSEINPQQLVPVLIDGDRVIRQSLAIIEYLDEVYGGELVLPPTARERARVRSLAQMIACDMHPLTNLRVLQYLETEFAAPVEARHDWVRHWVKLGLDAFEEMISDNPSTGAFCEGDMPTMADICLIPQLYNARRYGVELDSYKSILRVEDACSAEEAFERAKPENQPDAPVV